MFHGRGGLHISRTYRGGHLGAVTVSSHIFQLLWWLAELYILQQDLQACVTSAVLSLRASQIIVIWLALGLVF